MMEQKFILVTLNPKRPAEAMDRIEEAAGEGPWRIVSLLPVDQAYATRRVSPGNNDPKLLEGVRALVLVERNRTAPLRAEANRDVLENVN